MDGKDRCSPDQPLPAHGGLLAPMPPAPGSPLSPGRPSPMGFGGYPGGPPMSRTSPLMPHPHLNFEKSVYSSPPHASNKPENNQCRLIDYRGAKVAAFSVEGRELICLPQAFDLFLKHLVGGLHTVYTKLKRLGITPVVCNVEQVRILRGLGAIQPGVNRCKLIAPKEFDVLYEDCTNSSARPGRPPKRATLGSPDSLQELKKSRPDMGDFYHGMGRPAELKKTSLFSNGFHYPPYQLPFMSPLAHPAMVNLAMANQLAMRPDVLHAREPPRDSEPADLSISRHREHKEEPSHRGKDLTSSGHDLPDKPLNLGPPRPMEFGHPALAGHMGRTPEEMMANGRLALANYYRTPRPLPDESRDSEGEDEEESEDDCDDKDGSDIDMPSLAMASDMRRHHPDPGPPKPAAFPFNHARPGVGAVGAGGDHHDISPLETILMNILGLLKVAMENARMWEEQSRGEKSQLKMDVLKEKELRQSMERQLEEEQKQIGSLQRKLKKEKKFAKRLQDQLQNIEHTHLKSLNDFKARLDLDFGARDDENRGDIDGRKSNGSSPPRLVDSDNRGQQPPTSQSSTCHPKDNDHTSGTDAVRPGGDVHTTMESLLLASQRLAADSCHTAANGFIHSPLIKQTETV